MTVLGTVASRVGVYGGAFDPPHAAHHALAVAAITQLRLDVLHILPTGMAWHKNRALSSAEHRLAMVQLAFADVPEAEVDPREIRRAGATYTIDTLQELQIQYPAAKLFLVIGADQFVAFTTWHRWQDICAIATLSIAARAHSIRQKAKIATLYSSENQGTIVAVNIAMPEMPVSATDIRGRVGRSESIAHLVKPAVARYIATHHLYQNS